MKMLTLAALLTAAVISPDRVLAASFDCNKAGSANEKMICNDARLSALDTQLGQAYRRARQAAPDRRAFVLASDQQWRWREQNCHDRACLLDWYGRRQAELEAQAGASSLPSPVTASAPVPAPAPTQTLATAPAALPPQPLLLGLNARQVSGLAPAGSTPWPHYTRAEHGEYFYRDPQAPEADALVAVRYYGIEHGQYILEAVRGQTVLRYTCSSDCRYITQLALPGDVEKDSVILGNDHRSLPALIVADALNGLLAPSAAR